jgi:hypothetical protein
MRRSGPKPHLFATAANGRDHVEAYFPEIQIARITPVSPQRIPSHIADRVPGLPKSYWRRVTGVCGYALLSSSPETRPIIREGIFASRCSLPRAMLFYHCDRE